MKNPLLLVAAFCMSMPVYAQQLQDTIHTLQDVVVTGIQNSGPKATSLHIESYPLKQLEVKSPFNLSDALAEIPGISELTTGNAISKPVIRGLYGNRILVLLSGLRFDNQQFQDEHGLGLSQIGIDRVEVINGPASILYGTDAIGGVINVIEETPTQPGKTLDFTTRLYSNTLGTLTDVGYSNYAKNKTWWRIRGGIENHADYSDGNGNRVLDSRNKGYYAKAGFGFQRGNWTMNNTYDFSYNQFGFIVPDLNLFLQPDSRWSRSMQGPHHNVMLNVLSSQNTFQLKSSVLKVNVGVQSNHRMEDEGGGEISLNMHLLSALENARWEKYLNKKTLLVLNQQFTFENNTNLGKRILIPDANMLEGNGSGFLRFYLHKVNIEAGLGYNYKNIKTYLTPPLNTVTKDVHPFDIGRASANGMVGMSYNPNHWLNIKANIASGDRAPNLAELSSDGLHEGYYRYEIGNPKLKMEQNINGDLTVEVNNTEWFVSASGYYDRFFNYIYLAGDGNANYFGFPIYNFKQQDAKIYGSELIAQYKPEALKWYEFKETFSAIKGVLDEGGYLPYIPAYTNKLSVMFTKDINDKYKSLYIEPEFEYVFAQDHPAQFESSTGDYGLINLYSGIVTHIGQHDLSWNFTVKNLLNKEYADHLSRLKDPVLFPQPIYNQGRNFILSLSTRLGV